MVQAIETDGGLVRDEDEKINLLGDYWGATFLKGRFIEGGLKFFLRLTVRI